MRSNHLLAVIFIVSLAGCSSVYYGAMEKLGVDKREIMVDRVEDARDDQTEAKEQFQSALEKFAAVVEIDGGELEAKYKELKTEFERCEGRAKNASYQIASVENVAEALFAEWEAELREYSNDKLRRSSEDQMRQTRRRYEGLIAAMRRAEDKMQPVLTAFRDQVLFLKHNLNARAIASLQGTVVSLETDVANLVRDMEASIAEADAFIASMSKSE